MNRCDGGVRVHTPRDPILVALSFPGENWQGELLPRFPLLSRDYSESARKLDEAFGSVGRKPSGRPFPD